MASEPDVKVGDVPILFRPLVHPELGVNGYDGAEHSITTLPAGHQLTPGVKAFAIDTIFEKDVQVPMRDGVILRADIFRPAHGERVPAIVPWSPYGKTGRGTCPHTVNAEIMTDTLLSRVVIEPYAWQNGNTQVRNLWLREV